MRPRQAAVPVRCWRADTEAGGKLKDNRHYARTTYASTLRKHRPEINAAPAAKRPLGEDALNRRPTNRLMCAWQTLEQRRGKQKKKKKKKKREKRKHHEWLNVQQWMERLNIQTYRAFSLWTYTK